MSSLRSFLTDVISSAFEEQGFDRDCGSVTISARPELGQFQCNGAMAAAKRSKTNPLAVAEAVVTAMATKSLDTIAVLTVAGPGFINITVKDQYLASLANELASDERLGVPLSKIGKTIVLDFGGPNVAKPMHVGHLRSTIIGDSLQRLLRHLGDTVVSDIHLGDWGTQMGMLICELRKRQPDLPYFDSTHQGPYPKEPPVSLAGLEEMYPTASKQCKSDEEAMREAVAATAELQRGRAGYVALWKHFVRLSVEELKRDFASLGVEFDKWLGESSYAERMAPLVAQARECGAAVLSEGATVISVVEEGDTKNVPPLMLEKSQGGYLYATSDLAAIQERIEEFHANEILYVVDKRQTLHFIQLFRAARKARIAGPTVRLTHVPFGTMNGPDGKPFKTREGGVMKLSTLVRSIEVKATERMKEAGVAQDLPEAEQQSVAHMIALATLKFADLSNHRESDYVFDVDKFMKFEGKTGPYLLYTTVRIKSILRNAAAKGIASSVIITPTSHERQLILLLLSFPEVLANACEALLPNYLCEFAYEIAQEFNRFYRDCHILSEQDRVRQGSWLNLCRLVLNTLETVVGILGMQTPERM